MDKSLNTNILWEKPSIHARKYPPSDKITLLVFLQNRLHDRLATAKFYYRGHETTMILSFHPKVEMIFQLIYFSRALLGSHYNGLLDLNFEFLF